LLSLRALHSPLLLQKAAIAHLGSTKSWPVGEKETTNRAR